MNIFNQNKRKWLGNQDTYQNKNKLDACTILDRIPRVKKKTTCYGYDIWFCYEVSWLTLSGKPTYKVAELRIPLESKYIIESKSFKLYLNQFNFITFDSELAFINQINQDISGVIESNIQCVLHNPFNITLTPLEGICIDNESNLENRLTDNKSIKVENETLYSHLFRSNCPVTNQPDWASIIIRYSGQQINKEALVSYLLSYRQKQDFHEACIDTIFDELLQQYELLDLNVYGAFTRRGGIAIHPLRQSVSKIIRTYYFFKT